MTTQPLNLPDLGADVPAPVAAALAKLNDIHTRHAAAWAEHEQAVNEAAAIEAGAVERYAALLAESDQEYDATDERTARERVVDLERKVAALEHAHAVARGQALDLIAEHRSTWTTDLEARRATAAAKAAKALTTATASLDELTRLIRAGQWLAAPASNRWQRADVGIEEHLTALLAYVGRQGRPEERPRFTGIRGQEPQHLPVEQFGGRAAAS